MESETAITYVDLDAADDVVRRLRRVSDRVVPVETVAGCLANLSSVACVVLTDTVPEIDLVDLCTRIRTYCVDVPIVVFPEDGSEALAGAVIAAGADGYVPRAEGVDTLAERVANLLDRSSSTDAERPSNSDTRPVPATPDRDADDTAAAPSSTGSTTAPAERLEALQETTTELMRAESVDEVAWIVIDAAEHVIDRPLAALRLYDDESETLELAAATEELEAHTGDVSSVGPGGHILWEAYAAGEPRIVDDVSRTRLPYVLERPVGDAILYPLGDHGLLTVASSDDELGAVAIHLVRVLAATAEAALDRASRERELERTKTLVETVGDSVYAPDRTGTILMVNDRVTEVTGYDRDELVGEHVSRVLTDESVERGRKRVRALVSAGEDRIATYEVAMVTRDGERIPCEVNTTLLRTNGVHEGSAGIVRDISDRKRMELELVERKSKTEGLHEVASRLDDCETRSAVFELIVEAAKRVLDFDVCVANRIDGEYLVAAEVSSNISEGDYVERMHVDDGIAGRTYREQRTCIVDDSVDSAEMTNRTDTYRSLLTAPIGEHGVFQAVSTDRCAFADDDRELAELLLSHAIDTLDRLAFESELREERDRFAALFENVPDAVASVRQSGGDAIVESINPAFERVFGYGEEVLADRPIDQFIVPTDRTAEAESITRRGSNGEIVEAEVRRRTADGLRDFILRAVPVEMNESTGRSFGLYTDITARKQ